LTRTVTKYLSRPAAAPRKAIAAIAPHAGYVFSGALAGETLAAAIIPETVIILGPNHHGRGAPVAVAQASWDMPNGVVPIDAEIARRLADATPLITPDDRAHEQEHSLEVQVPFLQALQPQLSIVPIVVSQISYQHCVEVSKAIAAVTDSSEKDVLLLASTDMSHYESRASAAVKDRRALERVLALDAPGLYQTVVSERISMCGFIPVTITLLAALEIGATKAELIGYTDSGEVSGDTGQVVGYAGLILS
jgi:AmmeMemoRadiSam system protein B